jgi:hypothetical protein
VKSDRRELALEEYDVDVLKFSALDISRIRSAVARISGILAGYGRTFPDLFWLVRALKKSNALNLDSIDEISKDRNSFGNGCLALVYLLRRFLQVNGVSADERRRFRQDFCRLTHAHPLAVGTVIILACLLDLLEGGKDPLDLVAFEPCLELLGVDIHRRLQRFLLADIYLPPHEFVEKHRNNVVALETLFYTLYGMRNSRDMMELVGMVASFAGDCDSVLALALLLRALYCPCCDRRGEDCHRGRVIGGSVRHSRLLESLLDTGVEEDQLLNFDLLKLFRYPAKPPLQRHDILRRGETDHYRCVRCNAGACEILQGF